MRCTAAAAAAAYSGVTRCAVVSLGQAVLGLQLQREDCSCVKLTVGVQKPVFQNLSITMHHFWGVFTVSWWPSFQRSCITRCMYPALL